MNKKDSFDFYYVITGSLLLIIFSLIMYILGNGLRVTFPLDKNTVITLIGPGIGAFLGAYLTGKYTLKAAKYQVDRQENKEIEREQRVLWRSLTFYEVRLDQLQSFITKIYSIIDKPKGLFVKDIESFEGIRSYIEKELNTLKSYDITEIYSDNYYLFLSSLEDLEQIISRLDVMIDTIKNDEEDLYHVHKEIFDEILVNFKEDVDDIKEATSKVNI